MNNNPWTKLKTDIHPDGGKTVTWVLQKAPGIRIESRTVNIPHANRSGYWQKAYYYVILPDGSEKQFDLLTLAKRYVEVSYT